MAFPCTTFLECETLLRHSRSVCLPTSLPATSANTTAGTGRQCKCDLLRWASRKALGNASVAANHSAAYVNPSVNPSGGCDEISVAGWTMFVCTGILFLATTVVIVLGLRLFLQVRTTSNKYVAESTSEESAASPRGRISTFFGRLSMISSLVTSSTITRKQLSKSSAVTAVAAVLCCVGINIFNISNMLFVAEAIGRTTRSVVVGVGLGLAAASVIVLIMNIAVTWTHVAANARFFRKNTSRANIYRARIFSWTVVVGTVIPIVCGNAIRSLSWGDLLASGAAMAAAIVVVISFIVAVHKIGAQLSSGKLLPGTTAAQPQQTTEPSWQQRQLRRIKVAATRAVVGMVGFIIWSTAWVISRVFESHVLYHITQSCMLLAVLGAAAAVIKYVDKGSGSRRVCPQNRMVVRRSIVSDPLRRASMQTPPVRRPAQRVRRASLQTLPVRRPAQRGRRASFLESKGDAGSSSVVEIDAEGHMSNPPSKEQEVCMEV